MHVEWEYKEVVGMQAGGLLLTRRSERRYAEPRNRNRAQTRDFANTYQFYIWQSPKK